MRIAFAGTPPFAARALTALQAEGHHIAGVLTQPDRAAGRGLALQASAVKQEALRLGLPVLQPRSLRLDGRFPGDATHTQAALRAAAPDLMVVAAYGLILPEWALTLPRLGCINIHASLLPRWRGAAPVHRAIEAGDATTGVTIMQMDEGLDTGPMLMMRALSIGPDETTGGLLERLTLLGAELVVQAVDRLARGDGTCEPQPAEGVTYARKIDKAEAPIDWGQPAAEIERRVRAFNPAPGCTFVWEGETVKLWRAACVAGPDRPDAVPGQWVRLDDQRLGITCGTGVIEPLEVQRPGGRRMSFAQFVLSEPGQRIRPGQFLALSR